MHMTIHDVDLGTLKGYEAAATPAKTEQMFHHILVLSNAVSSTHKAGTSREVVDASTQDISFGVFGSLTRGSWSCTKSLCRGPLLR